VRYRQITFEPHFHEIVRDLEGMMVKTVKEENNKRLLEWKMKGSPPNDPPKYLSHVRSARYHDIRIIASLPNIYHAFAAYHTHYPDNPLITSEDENQCAWTMSLGGDNVVLQEALQNSQDPNGVVAAIAKEAIVGSPKWDHVTSMYNQLSIRSSQLRRPLLMVVL